jgi:hypothetical protein
MNPDLPSALRASEEPLPALDAAEIRVLGALVEKQITTPDTYPLTLNGLLAACNQLTSREPVVAYDEATVLRAVDGLRGKRLATIFSGAESRVAKYRHALHDALLLTPGETALLCVLLLRGPQTLGELRARSERLFVFDDLGEAEACLQGLVTRAPRPLVVRLPRAAGAKESRYQHLLGSPSAAETVPAEGAVAAGSPSSPAEIERAFAVLRAEISELRRQLADLQRRLN